MFPYPQFEKIPSRGVKYLKKVAEGNNFSPPSLRDVTNLPWKNEPADLGFRMFSGERFCQEICHTCRYAAFSFLGQIASSNRENRQRAVGFSGA